jgi:ubiquinol-cytochrome c reductase iron-sulfur subunit
MSDDRHEGMPGNEDAVATTAQPPSPAVRDDNADPIADPGLHEHQPRPTDVDARAEKRAERQVVALFGLSSLCAVLFVVSYFVFAIGSDPDLIAGFGASNLALGVTLGVGLLCIGIAAIHWARKLMSDVEIVEKRHPAASSPEDREEAVTAFQQGVDDSGIARRPLIRNSMLGALAMLGLPAIVLLRDLGPAPGNKLAHTVWKKGVRVVNDVAGTPIRPEEVEIGQLINAEPSVFFEENEEGEPLYEGVHLQQEKAKAAIILVRMKPDDITPAKGRENWGVEGSCASPRSAPTSGARSRCGSSRRITCSARVTSRPSTSVTMPR